MEQTSCKSFNDILKEFIENKGNKEVDLNASNQILLGKTEAVLKIIEDNWKDLEIQRKENDKPLTAEQWAMKKFNAK